MRKKNKKDLKDKKIKVVITPNIKKELTFEEIDEALGTTELRDALNDDTKSDSEKRDIINEQVSKYIMMSLGINEESDLTEARQALDKANSNYLNTEQNLLIKFPFVQYKTTMLGKDIVLLKRTVNNWKWSIMLMIINTFTNVSNTEFFKFSCNVWAFYLMYNLILLFMRIVVIVSETE